MARQEPVILQPGVSYNPGMMPTGVITTQPGYVTIDMQKQGGGLADLQQMPSITIREDRDIAECLLGDKIPCGPWGLGCGPPKKKYFASVGETLDQKLFYMKEESSCCPRRCWPRLRDFDISVKDYNTQREVFKICREISCGECMVSNCWPAGFYGWYGEACADGFQVKIEAPDGSPLGYVEQQPSCCSLDFHIMNRSRQTVFMFNTTLTEGCCRNPCWLFPCMIPGWCRWFTGCADVEAPLRNASGSKVGTINWQYAGPVETLCCRQHQFWIAFPQEADAAMRATLMGAAILFENFFLPWNPVFCPGYAA